jgi:hypothetical protein
VVFVASLRKERGRIVLAKADVEFLNRIGIHNEALTAGTKCASCTKHSQKETPKAATSELLSRVSDTFVENTPDTLRRTAAKAEVKFDVEIVSKLHTAGHSMEKIFKKASEKVGSPHAKRVIQDFVDGLKRTNHKVALSQIDCRFLKNKLGTQNVIVGAEKCASCSYRSGMHCGLTGGTLLSFPGMDTQSTNKKVATGAPKDGRAILNEFDLMGKVKQDDIDMTPKTFEDIE